MGSNHFVLDPIDLLFRLTHFMNDPRLTHFMNDPLPNLVLEVTLSRFNESQSAVLIVIINLWFP